MSALPILSPKGRKPTPLPHLSHSRVNKYLLCPEQYRLHYLENLRPKAPSAALVFGKILHSALASFFGEQASAIDCFLKGWQEMKDAQLTYGYRSSWESLNERGMALLERFLQMPEPRLGPILEVEKSFQVRVTSLHVPFTGIIDLVAGMKGQKTVVDFKTSSRSYGQHEAVMSDQLTAYQLAQPDAQQSALCVFVKTKDPRVEWHITRRSGQHLMEYLAKVSLVAAEITASHFYKRPGEWCQRCDFLPVCTGDVSKARETLVQIE